MNVTVKCMRKFPGHDGNNIYYSGESMIVDAMGEVLYTKAHTEDIFTMTLQKEKLTEIRSKLPFFERCRPLSY